MERTGQRLLLALTSPDDDPSDYSLSSVVGILAAFGGIASLILVVLMCSCRYHNSKEGENGQEMHASSKKGEKRLMVTVDSADNKTDVEAVTVNGCVTQVSSTLPGHSRQASSGSAHMRPTSLRELPAPPVSSHQTPNKALSGVEAALSLSGSSAGAASAGDYTYHHHRNKSASSISTVPGKEKNTLHNDGYDHLGVQSRAKPTDYDSLAEPESTDGETPVSETGGGVLDSHYSELRERTYAVVGDVKAKAKELFDPYSKVKNKQEVRSDYYSQVKDEDPYNHISDSSGNISMSFIRRLRQSRDLSDGQRAMQEESGSDIKRVLEPRAASRGTLSSVSNQQDEGDVEEEYAVVQKAKVIGEHSADQDGQVVFSDSDMSPYSLGPPEPPRLYNDYENAEDSLTPAAGCKREHKYSKVTARESLASMSARNALNPYEVVMDLPENMYATVEGGSGDGVVLPGGAAGGSAEKRLSQSSDTYAEIGVSGGGLSSSIISSSSSTGGNNNSCGSVAPIPPSLDSLHLMTKSQTSSEGDRLSDRHLASPEDSGMSLNLWEDTREDEDSEDGYSTLKKMEFSPLHSSLPTIPDSSLIKDEESGEVTLVPNYQTVKDCISDSEAMEDDPNYESVEETRAKVALLKFRDASSQDTRGSQLGVSRMPNMSSGVGLAVNSVRPLDGFSNGGRRQRRLDHDYEEVDVSPPSSPVSPPSSTNHTSSSSYHTATTTHSTAANHLVTKTVAEARKRVVQSHMYEELTEVKARTSEMRKIKNNFEDKSKSGSDDKKKFEEKSVSVSEEKRKIGSDSKLTNVVVERKKGRAGEKKKIGLEDKRKGGSANGTKL